MTGGICYSKKLVAAHGTDLENAVSCISLLAVQYICCINAIFASYIIMSVPSTSNLVISVANPLTSLCAWMKSVKLLFIATFLLVTLAYWISGLTCLQWAASRVL